MPLVSLFQKRNNLLAVAAISVATTVLTGCGVPGLFQTACSTTNDPHCFQEAAVQSGDVNNCDTVAQKEEFKKAGSNPPRDKCVVMVSANNEDPSTCKKAKGGLLSYSEQDCLQGIAETASNPSTCKTLGDQYTATCVNSVTKNTYDDIDEFAKRPNKTDADIQTLQQKMMELEKMNEMMSNVLKVQFDMKKAAVSNLRG